MLIVAADRRELDPLARRLVGAQAPDLELQWSRLGRLHGRMVLLVANGAGRERAAAAVTKACAQVTVAAIVSTGWCGALDPALEPGRIVVADRVLSVEPRGEFAARAPGGGNAYSGGGVLTANHVVLAAAEKSELRATGAVAVEMEAAGVAEQAAGRGLPFYCVRAVSDGATQSFAIDFNRARLRDGRFSTTRVLAQAGLSPARWRELLGLWQNSRIAAAALADALRSLEFEAGNG